LWRSNIPGLTKEQIRQAVGQTASNSSSSSSSGERIPSSVLRRGLRRLVKVCDVPLDESEQNCIISALAIGGTDEDYVSVSRWYQMFEVWPYQKDLRRSSSRNRNKNSTKTKRKPMKSIPE
jgi:hypothetical protein